MPAPWNGNLQAQDSAQRVATIVAMAHNLNINTISDGVGTEAQRRFVHSLGSARLQGYLASPPIPGTTFQSLLDGAPLLTPIAGAQNGLQRVTRFDAGQGLPEVATHILLSARANLMEPADNAEQAQRSGYP